MTIGKRIPIWLIILLVLVFLLRIPTFLEPFSYGDEMIYLTLGEAIRRGLVLYKQIHDNKPPLLYLLAAIAGNVFWFRVILAFWSLVTIAFFWKLSQALFPDKNRLQKISTIIFAFLTTIPLLEGQIANAEVFMIGPIIVAYLILLTKKLTPKNLFISGLFFSIATLFKVPAIFDIPPLIILWFISSERNSEKLKEIVKNTFYLLVGFLLPITSIFVWYLAKGALKEYFIAAYLQNIGYLSSWRPGVVQQSFLVKNTPVLIRFGILILGTFILYLKRNKISKSFMLITIWLLFTLFAVTLSERPYPHYLIQIVPPLSFLLAILFTDNKRQQILSIIPIGLALFAVVFYKFWYYPTSKYYIRFFEFATGKINKQQYFARFDPNVNRNYKIAEFVNESTKPKDKIFVWGDSPPIYALTRRLPPTKYVASYHINDFGNPNELLNDLAKDKPELIIILPEDSLPQGLSQLLHDNYILLSTIDGADIWHLLAK